MSERAGAHTFRKLSHGEQAAVRKRCATPLEVDLQPAIARELKGFALRLTRGSTSTARRSHPNHAYQGVTEHRIQLVVHLEDGNPGLTFAARAVARFKRYVRRRPAATIFQPSTVTEASRLDRVLRRLSAPPPIPAELVEQPQLKMVFGDLYQREHDGGGQTDF